MTPLDDKVLVAGQIDPASLEALAHYGVTMIVNNRPDREEPGQPSSAEMEKQKVSGAIRTDLILSGEIMAIALATVADRPFAIQAGALVKIGPPR